MWTPKWYKANSYENNKYDEDQNSRKKDMAFGSKKKKQPRVHTHKN